MKTFTLLFISTFIFTACTSNINSRSPNVDSMQLKINQPISVPAGSSFAYVKAIGDVVRRKEIGTYELYCKFLVPRSKQSGETVISPDTFEIHGIHRRLSSVMPSYFAGTQFAFNGHFKRNGNSNTQTDLELFFKISSVNQPQVKSLSCIRFSDPIFYNMPTLGEVQELFGELAEFRSANS